MKAQLLASPFVAPWRERAMVLAGKGASGLLPVVMLALCARLAGVRGMGQFAVAFSLAQTVAELSDFTSLRHVSRVRLAAGAGDVGPRLAAFNALRLAALGAGLTVVGAALAATLPPQEALPSLAVLLAAAWLFANNTSYATALAENDFLLVGAGPWIGLLVGVGVTLFLSFTEMAPGFWAVAAGLHAGKASETLALWRRFGLPGTSFRHPELKREWKATSHLMLVGLVAAANARVLVPMLAAIVGVVGAGFISVGLNLEAGILLLAVAISVPAFREAVDKRVVLSPNAAFRTIRRDWVTAVSLSAALTCAFLLIAGPVTRLLLGGASAGAALPVALVVAAAPFDTLCIFSGVCYHAAHHDRQYLRLTLKTTTVSLMIVAAGGLLGGTASAAMAFLLSRVSSAAVLYRPLLLPEAEDQQGGAELRQDWR